MNKLTRLTGSFLLSLITILSFGNSFNFLSLPVTKAVTLSLPVTKSPFDFCPIIRGAITHTAKYKYAVQRGDKSVYITGGENHPNPGDTMVLRASLSPYSYGYINTSGAAGVGNNVTIMVEGPGQVVFASGGVAIENSNFVNFSGLGTDSTYGVKITAGGTNMTIVGKCDSIDVGYVDMMKGAVGGFWDKTEVTDVPSRYGCDMSYLYPMHMMYHHLHHLRIRNIQGDAMYVGSTGSAGFRDMSCNGVVTQPKPAGMGYIEVDHIIFDSINRTALQISGSDYGWNRVHDLTITNCGYEHNPNQGAGLALGSLTDSADVYNCFITNTLLYNFYSYATGYVHVYNNHFDTAGQVGYTGVASTYVNPQQIPAALVAPSIGANSYVFENNFINKNSAVPSTQLVFYGDNTKFSSITVCNSGANVQNFTGVTINTSCGVVNQSPIVNAGNAQTITLPTNTVQLSATASDPDGSISSYAWTQVSGPTYNISNAAISNPVITNMLAGTYTFKCTVTDNSGATANANVIVIVNAAPNQLPVVNAGKDDSIRLPVNTYTLNFSSASDPDGSIASYSWAQIGGPSYTINNSSTLHPVLTNLVSGTYVFRLTVTDNSGGTSYDEMQLKVIPATNIPPVANAGFDVHINNKINSTSLNGTASSDADGTILFYNWVQTAGPATAIITDPISPSTIVKTEGLPNGTYTFKLTVTDNQGATGTDNVSVFIQSNIKYTFYRIKIRN